MLIVVLLVPFRLSRHVLGVVLRLTFQYVQDWFWVKELLLKGTFHVMFGIVAAVVLYWNVLLEFHTPSELLA